MKLGLHFQQLPEWHVKAVDETNVQWVKMINPSGDYPYHREVKIIGRIYLDNDNAEWERYGSRGEQGAEEYFRECLPKYVPWVYAWEAINEWPPFWWQAQVYNRFATRWVQLMHEHGFRTVIGSIPTGHMQQGHIQLLADCLEITDFLGLHEYSQPTMQTDVGWLCGRHKKTITELELAGIRVPPILITEAGIDGGAVTPERENEKRPKKGWKTFATRTEYKEQLRWYEGDCDDRVQAILVFVSGAVEEWIDFDLDEEFSRWVGMSIPYYYQSRQGRSISHIILHDTEGSAEAAEAWFRDPKNPSQSSAHSIITSKGDEWHIVPDELGANHAGFGTVPGMEGINPNLFSMGLELEYPKYPLTPPWPEAQLSKAAEVVKRWCALYGIPRDRVLLHKTIDPTRRSDPRNWDEQAFLDRIFGSIETELGNALQRIIVPLNANAALEGAGAAKGYLPASDELYYKGYVSQAFRDVNDRYVQYIAYCREGDWGNVRWFVRTN